MNVTLILNNYLIFVIAHLTINIIIFVTFYAFNFFINSYLIDFI